MADRLAASTNTYHTYSLEEALAGIAGAGFKSVELTSVPGWTEHVRRDADDEEIALCQGPAPARSDGDQSFRPLRSRQRRRCRRIPKGAQPRQQTRHLYVTTSTGGHDASSAGSLDDQRERFSRASARSPTRPRRWHHDLPGNPRWSARDRGDSADLVRRIGKPNVGINYDPGNVIFYGDTRPEGDIAGSRSTSQPHARQRSDRRRRQLELPAGRHRRNRLRASLRRLQDAGFAGPCSVEIEFQGEPWPSLDDVERGDGQSYPFVRQF